MPWSNCKFLKFEAKRAKSGWECGGIFSIPTSVECGMQKEPSMEKSLRYDIDIY